MISCVAPTRSSTIYAHLDPVYTMQIYPGELQKRINICPY